MASFYRSWILGLSYIAAFVLAACPDDITKKELDLGNLPTDFESVDPADTSGNGGTDSAIDPNVVPETCETNAQCAALVQDSDACLVALCDVTTKKCFVGEKKDLSECDDGDACTLFTVCIDGQCISPNNQVMACNDANPCTTDSCDPESGCVHTPGDGPCDDGDPCTVGDTCSDGVCSGQPGGCGCTTDLECAQFDDDNLCNGTMECDNGVCKVAAGTPVVCPASDDPCVVSQCVPSTGACINKAAADGTTCSDGVSCTLGDVCTQGKCIAGVNQCPECTSSAECAGFDDGNACNGAVLCINGKCASLGPVTCAPAGACLLSKCDPATGKCAQSPAPQGTSCDDFNPCTIADVCSNGACQGGKPKNCDDNNPCTADECSPKTGTCQHLTAPDCGGTCGDGFCGPQDSCTTCPEDCGFCPGKCGDGNCGPDEDCQVCPKDCGNCGAECGDGLCDPDENCKFCPKDCGPCVAGNGCEATNGPGCGGCECEGCVCKLDPYCCDIQWDDLCVSECANECNGCGIIPGGCGDGQCAPGESCQSCPKDCGNCPGACGDGQCAPGETCSSCPKDCGPCTPSNGCEPTEGPGCGGCPCESCVCKLDAFCCDVQWDSLCVEECANDCNGCSIIPTTCGDQKCGPNENCQSCPKDCGPCPNKCGDMVCSNNENCQTCPLDCGPCTSKCGDQVCSATENCQICPLDCGPCPSKCGDMICGSNENCQICPLDCGPCTAKCGDQICSANESCLTCPLDCGPCPSKCGDMICGANENCQTCPLDCGPCGGGDGCKPTNSPGCGGCVCEACVCAMDPFCCQTMWDSLCVSECTNQCNGCNILPGGCGDGQCGPNETCQSCPKDCGTCPTPCGDGMCGPNENCQTCPKDCGTCPTLCGNGICGPNETCQSCPKDCGTCPAPCGDGMCGPNENCQTCPKDCGTCPTLCGNGICGPNETCQSCPKDCGTCPTPCGNGKCEFNENCQSCPKDCGTCPLVCGDGVCGSNENCKSCPKDCGPCDQPTGCLPLDQAGCSGCLCEQCVCQADPFCCDVQWDGACVEVCAWKCNGCDPNGGGCGDGVCGAGESCQNCVKDCGECSPQGAGCTVSDIAGCGGCACEECVCDTDPFCCEVQWDELCVEECASLCNGCDATFPNCGDGNCSFAETCNSCPKDCGECPPDGAGCFATEKPGCGGCACEACVCEMDSFCCDSAWDDICVSECAEPCGGCEDPTNSCGDGVCVPGESCMSCPIDCGPCKPPCGNGLCESQESCMSCPVDCGPCSPDDAGCVATNKPGCGGCDCEECVCKMDSFCCNTAWDGICANECKTPCGGCGGTPTDVCGNNSCGPTESCTTCPQDCGSCPPICGDKKCSLGESCQNCPTDCGACAPVCGDKQCNGNETCQTCPADCGNCTNPGGLSCVDIYNCYMDCETTTCANQCISKGSDVGKKLFNVAYECVVGNGCFQYDTDAEIQNCAIQFCFQQIVQCVTQSPGGIAP